MCDQLITITLPRATAEYLADKLGWVTDEGPTDEGWQSDELRVLVAKLNDAVNVARGASHPEYVANTTGD